MLRSPLIGILLLAVFQMAAQKVFLPVKIKNQWTFLQVTDTVIVDTSRQYDYIGEVNLPWFGQPNTQSDHFLIENKGKLGLVNASFEEILSPLWNEIQPISKNYFLVDDQHYTIINAQGKDLLNGNRYEAIKLTGNGKMEHFLVKREGKWGVHSQGQKKIAIAPAYQDIEYLNVKGGLFKVMYPLQDSIAWSVIDWNNKELPHLKNDQQEIIMAAAHLYFITQKIAGKINWSIRDLSGKEVMILAPQTEIKLLNKHLMGFKENPGDPYTVLIMGKEITPIPQPFTYLNPIDEHFVFFRSNYQSGLILPDGDLLILDGVSDMSTLEGSEDLYRIKCFNDGNYSKWGLFSLSRRAVVLHCQYDSIGAFYGNLARCFENGKVGLLNKSPMEIVPPEFEEIPDIEEQIKKVQCYRGDSTTVYYISELGEVDGEPYSARFIPIIGKGMFYGLSYNYDSLSKQAATNAPEQKKDERPFLTKIVQETPTDTLWIDENRVWDKYGSVFQMAKYVKVPKRNKSSKGKKKKKRKTGEYEMKWRRFGPKYQYLKTCTDVNWTLAFYDDAGLVNNELTRLSSKGITARKIDIFLNDEKKFIPDLQIMGIRLSDFREGLRYAAFLDLNGRMGLIDQEGRQLMGDDGKPLRLTYVGKPSEGKIRVCQNGCELLPLFTGRYALSYSKMLDHFFVATKDLESRPRPARSRINKPSPIWGYMDEGFKMVIPFNYREATDFRDSFAINIKGKKLGVINHQNEVVIPFKYDEIIDQKNHWRVFIRQNNQKQLYFDNRGRPFDHERNALLSSTGSTLFAHPTYSEPVKFGYIDANGKAVIPFVYDEALDFSEGLAAVRKGNRWFFIDPLGKVRIEVDSTIRGINQMNGFREGLCLVRKTLSNRKKKYGYLDTTGHMKIPPRFDIAEDFAFGVAIVDSLDFSDYQPGMNLTVPKERGLIDKNGNFLVPYKYERIYPFNQAGFTEVADSNATRRGIMNRNGKLLTQKLYPKVKRFQDGFATFNKIEWALMDYTEKVINLPTKGISDISYFSDGHLWVKDSFDFWNHLIIENGKALLKQSDLTEVNPFLGDYSLVQFNGENYLYRKNQTWVEPQSGQHFRFWSENLIGVQAASGEFYLNSGLQNIYHRSFNRISAFNNNIAHVIFRNKSGVINRKGMFLIPPKYKEVMVEKEGYLRVQPLEDYIGIIDKKGKMIVPVKYDFIQFLSPDLIRVERDDFIGYYRFDGKPIWELQE